MKKENERIDILKKVLIEFNKIRYFKYPFRELKEIECYGGRLLYPFLLNNNYIDEQRNLIKPVDLSNIYEIKNKIDELRFSSTKREVNIFESEDTCIISLDDFKDEQIVTELRKRGYDVLTKKIVEL